MALVDIGSDIAALQVQADALTAGLTKPGGVLPQASQVTTLTAQVTELVALANVAVLEGGEQTFDPLAPPSYNAP